MKSVLLILALMASSSAHAGKIKVRASQGPNLIVYIDGEERGSTPLTVTLPDGDYTIKVKEKPFLAAEIVAALQISHNRDGELTFSWANGGHQMDWLGPDPEPVELPEPVDAPEPLQEEAVAEAEAFIAEPTPQEEPDPEPERIARLEAERAQQAQQAAQRQQALEQEAEAQAAEQERQRVDDLRISLSLDDHSDEIAIVANSRIMDSEPLHMGEHDVVLGPLELTYRFGDAEISRTLLIEEQDPLTRIPLPWALEVHHPTRGLVRSLHAPEQEQVQETVLIPLPIRRSPTVAATYTVDSLPGQVQSVQFFPERHPAIAAFQTLETARAANNRARTGEWIAYPAAVAMAGLSAAAFAQTSQSAAFGNQASSEEEYAYYRQQSSTFMGLGVASAGAAVVALGTAILSNRLIRKPKAKQFREAKQAYVTRLEIPVDTEVTPR